MSVITDEARELTGIITDELQKTSSDDMEYQFTYRGTLLFNANNVICDLLKLIKEQN